MQPVTELDSRYSSPAAEPTVHFCSGADEQKAVNLRTNSQVILTTG